MMVIHYVYTFISDFKAVSQLLAFVSPWPGRQRAGSVIFFVSPKSEVPCGTGREEALRSLTERRAGEVRLTERQCHRFTGGLRAGDLRLGYPSSLGGLQLRGSRPSPVSKGDY